MKISRPLSGPVGTSALDQYDENQYVGWDFWRFTSGAGTPVIDYAAEGVRMTASEGRRVGSFMFSTTVAEDEQKIDGIEYKFTYHAGEVFMDMDMSTFTFVGLVFWGNEEEAHFDWYSPGPDISLDPLVPGDQIEVKFMYKTGVATFTRNGVIEYSDSQTTTAVVDAPYVDFFVEFQHTRDSIVIPPGDITLTQQAVFIEGGKGWTVAVHELI